MESYLWVVTVLCLIVKHVEEGFRGLFLTCGAGGRRFGAQEVRRLHERRHELRVAEGRDGGIAHCDRVLL